MRNRNILWASGFVLWTCLLVLNGSPSTSVVFGFVSAVLLSIGTYRFQSELVRMEKPYIRQPDVISLAIREPKQVGLLNASLIWLFHPGFFAAVCGALILHFSK